MQINRKYKNFDPRVKDVLTYILKSVEDKTKLDEAYELSFDLLATQLHIYYKCLDFILEHGVNESSYQIRMLNKAHANIQGQLSHFGLTPEALSRIRQYGDKTESAEDLINKLLE